MLSSEFLNYFEQLEDPRVTNHNTRHKFIDIIVMGFIATLCGCDDWEDVTDFCEIKEELFSQILELPNGIPSQDTFTRVFSMIDTEHFEEVFIEWMQDIFQKTNGEIIALDGKTLCGSRAKGKKKGIHIVHAFACKNKLSLGSIKVDDKSNEITAIPKLLKLLDITKCTITIDAMGCQKKIAEEIMNNGADYVLCVKGNQKELQSCISTVFNIAEKKAHKQYSDSGKQIEKGHGRIESRQYMCLPLTHLPYLREEWAGIQSVAKVVRIRNIDGKETHQVQYYISSHDYKSDNIATAIRKHWGIENCLHWHLDVSFNEDKCRSRTKNAAESLCLMRKISLAYLKKSSDIKTSIRRRRKKSSLSDEYLFKILNEGMPRKTEACEI